MEDLIAEILPETKLLLGFTDEEHDELLTLLIETAVNDALAYCRLDFLPKQLYGLIAQITAKLWRTEGYGGAAYAAVRTIQEGDRRIEFDLSADNALGAFRDRLKPYVNKAGRLPSELDGEETA